MNTHLETIADVISMLHSKRYSDDSYTLEQFDYDLNRLLFLRQFVVTTVDFIEDMNRPLA